MTDWLEEGDRARRAGRFAAAEEAYRSAIEAASRNLPSGTYGSEHLPLAEAEIKMGRLYETWGRPRAAEAHYREALRIYSNMQGDEYFELALARDRVAVPEPERASA